MLLLWGNPVLSQASHEKVFKEKEGLLLIDMEDADLRDDWVKDSAAENYTGSGYIYWSEDQYFNETGHGELIYPIEIKTSGIYRIIWRMMVGKGEDVTNHNDNWLKIKGAQIYGEKPNGDRVMPRPACEWVEGFDCPNGTTNDGFFKVYGQDKKFIWQANTSDNDGHDFIC